MVIPHSVGILPLEVNFANISARNIYVRQDYVLSPPAVPQHLKGIYTNHKVAPDLIIIVGQVLHQLNDFNSPGGMDRFLKGNKYLKKFYPHMQQFVDKWNSTVVFLNVEPLDAENAMMDKEEKRENYPVKNSYIKVFNDILSETVPITGYGNFTLSGGRKKIFRMAANLETVKSPFKDRSLLVEGIHLSWKRIGPVITAPSILANMNILLNLLCNRLEEDQEYCCHDE